MLSTNLPLMKANLNALLTASKGNPVYDAAYNAYYESNKCTNNIFSPEEDPNGISNTAVKNTNENLKKLAENFATEFCNNLKSGGFMDSIADEIDGHIKSMMLSINVPVIPPTLISPVGPVTGSLMISEMAGAQITIS